MLVYASRGPNDIVFGDELRAIEHSGFPNLNLIHVLSEAPASWTGATGRLDAERLARLCGGVEGRAFYLCCPPAMGNALMRGLRERGVDPRRIHADQFSL